MSSLIETFHIDLKLLIAQATNFAIVFSVLYFFALKPLMKTMGERTKTIEKGLADAKKIEENLAKAEADYKEKINEAKKEASAILTKTMESAEIKKKETINKAKEEIGQIINQEKAKIQTEKGVVMKEIKKEVADLVVASLEKILKEKIDHKKDKEIIKEVISKK
jgi:F-type H+-transporting ATPase subunit b